MPQYSLTDEQWLVLDLLMRARQKGVHKLNRMELLHSALPQGASMKLTFAALVMPGELVKWVSHHDFTITDAGVSLYNLRFGKAEQKPEPSTIADAVICLPGPEHYRN